MDIYIWEKGVAPTLEKPRDCYRVSIGLKIKEKHELSACRMIFLAIKWVLPYSWWHSAGWKLLFSFNSEACWHSLSVSQVGTAPFSSIYEESVSQSPMTGLL